MSTPTTNGEEVLALLRPRALPFSLFGSTPGPEARAERLERGGGAATFPEPWRDGDLVLALDGYMVGEQGLLCNTPASRREIADAVRGDLGKWLAGLRNGAFNLVVHDPSRRRTLVASDRRGILPLFVMREPGGGWRLASDHAALFAGLDHRPAIDRVGAAEIYLFGYPIGERTSHEGVSRLPAGTITSLDWDGTGHRSTPWAKQFAEDGREETKPEGVETILDRIVETFSRAVGAFDHPQSPFGPHPGIKLSGGMDSRLIAATWRGAPLAAYTFGEPASAEIRIAAALARRLGFSHRLVPVVGDLFENVYATQIARFGMAEWFHSCLVPAMAEDGVTAAFDGLGGDVLIGGLTLKRKGSRLRTAMEALGIAAKNNDIPPEDEAVARFIHGQIRLADADLPVLTREAHAAIEALGDEILADLVAESARFRPGAGSFEQLYTRIMLNNRTRRHVAMQGAVCRPAVESLYPFLDEEVQRLALSLPTGLVANKRLYIALFSRRFPAIRGVPAAMSMLPFHVPETAHYAGRAARVAYDALLRRLFRAGSRRATNGVQWEAWFRGDRDLRDGMARLIADSPVIDRGALAGLLERIGSGEHIARGTRIMYTASYAALFL